MSLDTYTYYCDRCNARVQVTPTNENRMLYVVTNLNPCGKLELRSTAHEQVA